MRLTLTDRPLSKGRILARIAVWAALGVVLFVRYAVMPPDPGEPVVPGLASVLPGRREPPMRRRYRPTEIQQPQSAVPGDLPRLHLEIAPSEVATLRGYFWNGWRGGTQERPEVLAVVREGDQVYPHVALHLKGSAGSFRPFDDKPALTLNFSKYEPGRPFRGHSKISLNNSVQDPTYLCEAICREMIEAAGVPVPRVEFATVLINGADKGLYVLAEGYSKGFLRRHFHNVEGNLYDGGFVRDIHPDMQVNVGNPATDHPELRALLAAASVPETADRWTRLQQVLDVDRFITLLALEVLMCHWDGYAINRNNYRLFHDRETGRMVFMPHGLDQTFDRPPGRYPVDGPILPPLRGMVALAVMSTPQGRARYLERLGALCTNQFSAGALTNRVHALAQRIAPTLAAYAPELARQHAGMVSLLCDRITQRFQSVAEQLRAPAGPERFDAEGVARLTRWQPRPGPRGFGVRLDRLEADGRPVLRVAFLGRPGTASWRTRAQLEPGRYRFEGQVRGGDAAVEGWASLQVGGGRVAPQRLQGAAWLPLECEFKVTAPQDELQLACEFTAQTGEAWFDLRSLRLVRLSTQPR